MFTIVKQRGVTLIELVISMVMISIALMVVTMMVGSQSELSHDPMLRIRATELGQSLLNEITSKSFDQNSDRTGGILRCDDTVDPLNPGPDCTNPLTDCDATAEDFPDAEEASRDLFNDVDDYNCLNQTGSEIANALGTQLDELYSGFNVQVRVVYDGNYDGIADANRAAKLISVQITHPEQESIVFSTYRANY